MIRFIIIAILLISLIVIALNLFTDLTKGDKLKLFGVIGLLITFAFLFESKQESHHDIASRFMQNRNIKCNGTDVNSSEFNYVSGTLSFVGKVEHNRGLLFDIKDCK